MYLNEIEKLNKKCRIYLLYIMTCIMALPVYSQAAYIKEQLTLTNMLSGKDSMDLQKAVYAVENAYYNGNLNEEIFNQQIEWYTNFCRGIMQSGDIRYEGQGDEQAAKAQCAVFVFMTDSIPMQVGDTVAWLLHLNITLMITPDGKTGTTCLYHV